MSEFLLIISFIAFHIPSAFIRDTQRRFKRMQMYNPDKASTYDYENGYMFNQQLNKNKVDFILLAIISSFVFALVPLIIVSRFHWLILIVANFIFVGLTPTIAFFFTPRMSIHSRSTLQPLTRISLTIGIIALIIGLAT